jgi:hypothetical protein
MLQLNLPTNCSNQIYESSIVIKPKRNEEIIQSIIAHRQLYSPKFFVKFEQQYNTYSINFVDAWKRINLPIDYFTLIDTSTVDPKRFDSLSIITEHVNNQLKTLVSFVQSIISRITPSGNKVFASVSFWELVNEWMVNRTLFMNGFEKCFDLSREEDELTPLFTSCLNISGASYIKNHFVIKLNPQSSIYYTNLIVLRSVKSFKIIRELENKKVVWFKNKAIDHTIMRDLVKSEFSNKVLFYNYHITQNLKRPHLFEYTTVESLDYGYGYNAFRNWKVLNEVQVGSRRAINRISYGLSGVILTKNQLLFSIFGTAVYPSRYNYDTFNDYEYVKKVVYEMYNSSMNKQMIDSIAVRLPMYYGSMYGTFWRLILKDNIGEIEDAYPINWHKVSLAVEGMHVGDNIAKRLRVSALPDPTERVNSINIINTIESIRLGEYFEWNVYPNMLYSVKYYDLIGNNKKLKYKSNIDNYRSMWSKFRNLTKRVIKDGRIVGWESYYNELKDHQANPKFIQKVVSYLSEFKDEKYPNWNGSTIKILSIMNMVEELDIIKVDPIVPYKILFLGVITEPVQEILRSMSDMFDVMTGIGSQAISPNLRSDLELALIGGNPHIIFSDIDQSEEKTIQGVVRLVVKHLRCLLQSCKILVYKVMYTFPEVIDAIGDLINELKVTRVFLLDSLSSGPYGTETYFMFLRDNNSEYTMSSDAVLEWVDNHQIYFDNKFFRDDLYEMKEIKNEHEVIASLSSDHHFTFCFTTNEENYNDIMSVASTMSDAYTVQPVGDVKNFEIIIYGERSRRRAGLMMRINAIPRLTLNQGGAEFPLSGPTTLTRLPVFRKQGSTQTESRYYNLCCKMIIRMYIERMIEQKHLVNIMDIGGRSAEFASVLKSEWNYTVEDKHILPDHIMNYNIGHLDSYCDWKTLDKYDEYNVIIATFVVMSEPSTAQAQIDKIQFLLNLSKRGKAVFYNYYSIDYIDRIASAKHRDISINEDRTHGSFSNYEPKPALISLPNHMSEASKTLKLSIKTIITTMMYYGMAVSTELIKFIDDFNQFCPLELFNGMEAFESLG